MKLSDYRDIPIVESGDPMVDLGNSRFVLEPVQFRKGYTDNPQLWVRQTVAQKLEEIQLKHLDSEGWTFKIWDAWRPRGVQNKVYAACWNDFAARHPDWDDDQLEAEVSRYSISGSEENLIPPHTTGGAVDLTIVDADGQELDMGSAYCDWNAPMPMCDVKNGPDAGVCGNLRGLLILMQEAGFAQDPDQWWHFDYGNQKWAKIVGAEVAIYGELNSGMGFMKKGWGYGHGMKLPFEEPPRSP